MSNSERFEINITCVHVPDALDGVPLPIEIVSPSGLSQRGMLVLDEKRATPETVNAPGRYLVRAELPSGRWIAESFTILEFEGDNPSNTHIVELNFISPETAPASLSGAGAAPVTPQVRRQLLLEIYSKRVPNRSSINAQFLPKQLENLDDGDSASFVGMDFNSTRVLPLALNEREGQVPLSAQAALRYGFFSKWDLTASIPGKGGALQINPLPLGAEDSTEVPGSVSLSVNGHPGAGNDRTAWRPMLVRARLHAGIDLADFGENLIVWPPSLGSQSLTLLPDPSVGERPDNSLLAFARGDHRVADALFAFIQGGALDSARKASPMFIQQVENLLAAKGANPMTAILAAYTLLKVGNADRLNWIENLANWFPGLPDGAIIYGWYLIRAGEAEKAPAYFRLGFDRGVPMYSEGVRLLRDGLNFLHGLYPDDEQITLEAIQANYLAAAANLNSELTCLRLGEEIRVSPPF